MGKEQKKWTPKQRQALNQQYDEAIGKYANAMTELGIHPDDVSRMVVDLASKRGSITRNNMLRFIQVAEAASQAAKKGRGNQEE